MYTASDGARPLRILTALAEAPNPMSPGEIADVTGLSRATAYRMLDELETHGWVIPDTSSPRRYRTSLQVVQLGIGAIRQHRARQAILPAAVDLASSVSRTVTTALYEDGDVVYVDTIRVTGGRVSLDLSGQRIPALASASGRVLLSHQHQSHIDHVLERSLPRFTEFTKCDAQELAAELELIRNEGYGQSDREFRLDGSEIAMAVFDRDGTATAAIGVHLYPLDPAIIPSVLFALKSYSERASMELGYRSRSAGVFA